GALLGIVFAAWTGDVLLGALPFGDASRVLSTQPNVRMGAFAAAIALLTGIIFGLVPALQAVRPQVFPALKGESTGAAAGGPHFGFRRTLVAAQIALSLLLLIGAGLFARSLYNLRNLNPGFEPEHLLTFSVD